MPPRPSDENASMFPPIGSEIPYWRLCADEPSVATHEPGHHDSTNSVHIMSDI